MPVICFHHRRISADICIAAGVGACPEVVPPGGKSAVGNGLCDAQYNIPECSFDGGDCCAKTCMPSNLLGA